MLVLKQGFFNIFTFILCGLIPVITVHGPLPTRIGDHCGNGSIVNA